MSQALHDHTGSRAAARDDGAPASAPARDDKVPRTTLSLGVMPREATPYAEISLSPGALEEVARRLSEAADGWREVLLAVDEESKRQTTDDPGTAS